MIHRLFRRASHFVLVAASLSGSRGAAQAHTALTAPEILARYTRAIGGYPALSSTRTEERWTRSSDGSTRLARVDRVGNRHYSRSESDEGAYESGYDGSRAWSRTPSFRGCLADTDPRARSAARRTYALWEYAESGKAYTRLPDDTIDGRSYLVVAVDEEGFSRPVRFRYFFDPVTFLLRREAVGRVGTIYDYFDYRRVGGVLYPFRTVERQPHGTTVQTTLRIRRNTVIPDGAFRFGASGCGSGAAAGADAALGLPPGASAEDSLRVRTVELVWRIIAESHYDTTFGGVDWNAVRLRYRALAGTAADREEFHRILHRMVGELRQTHFRVGTSDGPASGGGEAGMDLTWNLSKLVVTRVRPGSAAERAGIGPGDIIQRIGGRTPDDLLSAYDRGFGQAARREPHRRVRAAGAALAGRAGDTLVMEIDRAGRTDSARLVLQARQGLRSLDDLSEFEVRRLAGNVAYIRFSSFFGSADARFRAAIDTLGHSRGLIIDLRGNPGGAKSMIAAIAGTLFVRGGTLGSTRFRYQTRDFAFQGAGRRAFRRPVMVLVDERTGSSAEVLAGALQSLGRARVVGDTTAGAVLPSVETPLPTGAVLQYVISDYRTPDGQVLEGRGVIPDIFVRPTPAELRAGHDPALDRAHSELLAEARSGCTGPASAAGALHLQRVHPAPAQAREEPAAVGGRRR